MNPRIKLLTNFGAMTAELYPEKAPLTVANFLRYVERGFYDDTIFHRIIKDFMIQGGGMMRGIAEKKDTEAPIQNEAANGLRNTKYALAMARLPAPHTASSQFFINTADNGFLDYTAPTADGFGYCVFGRLTDGAEVADEINRVETESRGGYDDVPVRDVVLESAARIDGQAS